MDTMSSTSSKRLTKRMTGDIAGAISENLLSGLPDEVLKRTDPCAIGFIGTSAVIVWLHVTAADKWRDM